MRLKDPAQEVASATPHGAAFPSRVQEPKFDDFKVCGKLLPDGSTLLSLISPKTGQPVRSEELYRKLDADRKVETAKTGYMVRGKGVILCPGITHCQAIVFWDSVSKVAVVAHKNQSTDPRDMLSGQASYYGVARISPPLEKLLPTSHKESVFLAHCCIYDGHPHSWIEKETARRGFNNTVAFFRTDTNGRHLHVAVDARTGVLVMMSEGLRDPKVVRLSNS